LRKLFALYKNEMIKISKKVSVIVILAIMVAIIFGFGGLAKFQVSSNEKNNNNYSTSNKQFLKDEMSRQQADMKTKIAEVQKEKDTATGVELINLEAQEKSHQNQLDMLQYAIDKDILLGSNSFRAQATQILFSNKEMVRLLSDIPATNLDKEQEQQLEEAQSNSSTLQTIIQDKDFKGYISFLNNSINSNTGMSDDEKKIYLGSNEIRSKYNLTGEEDSKIDIGNANYLIAQIEKGKLSLLKDMDYTNNSQIQKALTPELRESIKNDIAVAEYKLGSKTISITSSNSMDMSDNILPIMLKIGIFMIVILIMILAGGSISSEMSTGSIKSLIISPTKRWKIFTAKFLSLLTIGVIAALLAYIFSIIANGIFFGFNTGSPYIYATNGVAYELNFYIYQLARLFTEFIVVIVYMTFAFMLSIITRNTAASVAITIGTYFVGSSANFILMRFTKGDWRKFIPFNNLDFTSKIFSSDTISQTANGLSDTVNNSLTFSLIYIAILIICMGYVGLDSFNRRDIK
jgi:ABC-type transport system involved in multi-copper enzyme maturation permease subunit